jgi:SAM-dependent methyltransferase
VLLLRRLMGGARFDLLDVGAASGGLLGVCEHHGIAGRRSALDVIRYPGIERHLSGEFIEGFLDDSLPGWSGEPYDVVTLFDVLEHLYDPVAAFENLRLLLRPNGLVFIETGNAASFWPQRIGIAHWWYVRLLEHHLFWSRAPLERIAAAHGFRLVYWRAVRHKSRRHWLPPGAVVDSLKSALYLATSRHYSSFARLFGKQGVQPWFPFGTDHFQACLVKV